MLLAQRKSTLRKLYRLPLDMLEQLTSGLAHVVVVNSLFTARIFAKTFRQLNSRGLIPRVLHPAVECRTEETKQYTSEGVVCPGLAASVSLTRSKHNDIFTYRVLADIVAMVHLQGRIFLSINRFERKKEIDLVRWEFLF